MIDQICRYQKCGKLFHPVNRQRKFCSVQCRRHDNYDRNLARKLERNRVWRRNHPQAQKRHQDRKLARERQFLRVPKPQGLNLVQIKMLEEALAQQAQRWANQHIVRLTSPVRWRNDQEVRDLRRRVAG